MKRSMRAAVVLGFLLPGGARAQTHPLGWEDMFAMVRLDDPRPSPDGRWVLFARTAYDIEANKGNADLALVSADGKELRRLTFDPGPDNNGRWAPDGASILFLSARSGSSQLHRLPAAGGEAEKVTSVPVDLDGFELSPDGQKILFWTGVFPDCKDLECTAKRLKEREEDKVKARVFDSTFIRHWDTWNDGRRNHLFVMSLADQKPVDLTAGMDQDAPTKPFGGADEIAWSPDGRSVAFTSKPSAGEAWTTNTDIYLVPADGSAPPRSLSKANEAADSAPVFSPDGRTLAYLAMKRPGYESDRRGVILRDLEKGSGREIAADWDRSAEELLWSADGKTLFAVAEENARSKVFALDAASGAARALVSEGKSSALRLAKDGRLVFLRTTMTLPKELFALDAGQEKPSQLTRVNQERLDKVRFGAFEDFWFESAGRKVHGWFVKPVDAVEGKTYPLAFMVHGGPQGSWLDEFHYRWNPEFYAGAGYAVLAIDFRGSTGYGQPFTDAIRGDWGPGPYSDLMAGLKEALQRYPLIDGGRMCALGASFGGYMVNWIAGQDHPFRCLVTHDGDFDMASSYYNTEELWFPEWEMTGPPWEKGPAYAKNSPSARVAYWKTPTLVIQGAKDFRVVETEGFSTFNALQRRGVPSRLLYFPDEGHWVLKPQNSRLWHRTVLDWLGRWTGPAGK